MDFYMKMNHLAIILDGNRRWAVSQGLQKWEGHKKGEEVLEDVIRYCNKKGLKYLTVYAFSTENWKRTVEEVGYLMKLLGFALDKYIKKINMDNVKIKFIGDKDGVDKTLKDGMNKLEEKTKNNDGLLAMIAFNYGGRSEITNATKKICRQIVDGKLNIDDITEQTISNNLYTAGIPDPDMVVRTSGELRTSNFLPWQITYSEFLFMDKYWPEFTNSDIDYCIEEFEKRQIRKGK